MGVQLKKRKSDKNKKYEREMRGKVRNKKNMKNEKDKTVRMNIKDKEIKKNV